MGLEALTPGTYIGGLSQSWPTSGEQKSQGDDHLRLIKGALQNTFPTASKPFYFPKGEATSAPLTLDITDQLNVVAVTTTGGDVTVTLPSGFTTNEAGWSCEVVKVSGDVNAAMVAAASGSIFSRVGSTATIRVGAFCEPARFLWTGSVWIATKPGPLVGSTFNWDGSTVPFGCMVLDGSSFSGVTFAELNNALGTTTLKDKRGRIEAGVDSGGLRLTAAFFGAVAALGAVGGAESTTLTGAQSGVAAHQHDVFLKETAHSHGYDPRLGGAANGPGGAGGLTSSHIQTDTALTGITIGSVNGVANDNKVAAAVAAAASAGHSNVQATIVTQKLIRAC
jgi:hypothetical protein